MGYICFFLFLLISFSHLVLCSTRFKESSPWSRSSMHFTLWSFRVMVLLGFPCDDRNCLHPHFSQWLPSPHGSTTKNSLSIPYPSEAAFWHIKLKCHWFQFALTQQTVMCVSQSPSMKKLLEVSASRVPIWTQFLKW